MNRAVLIGRLTSPPETRQTPNGVSVTTFSLAVNRRMNREVTDYFNIVAWRGLADICAKHLVKGQRIAVTGEIQTRSYDDKNGVKRYVTEIVADEIEFLDKPSGASAATSSSATTKTADAGSGELAELEGVEVLEDEELPF